MFKTAIKRKFRTAITLLLAMVFAIQMFTIEAFASNSDGVGGTQGATLSTTNIRVGYSGFAVFLTNNPDYIIDRDESKLQKKDTSLEKPANTSWNEGYDGMSVNTALAQQFRRSYVSWTRPEVQNSIMFFGVYPYPRPFSRQSRGFCGINPPLLLSIKLSSADVAKAYKPSLVYSTFPLTAANFRACGGCRRGQRGDNM
ncbi:MAG: hypothetical protein FWH08_02435 [Oscillospiraceae bacterium]|nr:hypothetical protein [Oscillospiraceae bacterium]